MLTLDSVNAVESDHPQLEESKNENRLLDSKRIELTVSQKARRCSTPRSDLRNEPPRSGSQRSKLICMQTNSEDEATGFVDLE